MAKHFQANGKTVIVKPENGKHFTLEEQQKYVGGYIEYIHLRNGKTLVVNEEGNLKKLPTNEMASLTCVLNGVMNNIVGDALLCFEGELS